MNAIQKAIKNYRKTWVKGKPHGTIKALAHILGKSTRTIVYYNQGRNGWTEADVEKIRQETIHSTYTL